MNTVRIALIGGGLGALAWWMASRSALDAGGAMASTDASQPPDSGFLDVALGVAGSVFGGGQAVSMRMSFAGIELLKQFKGFKSQVYDANPPKRDWTIGYGHKLKGSESFPNGVTQDQARRLLVADVGFAEDRVNRNVTVALSQSQFDALVSLAYNLTTRSWLAATARINRGESASTVFNRFIYAGGKILNSLVSRRKLEVALFSKDSGGVA